MRSELAPHAVAFAVFDPILREGVAPPGARGAISGLIDTLRSGSAPVEVIKFAESLSLAMLKLDLSRLHNDGSETTQALEEIRELASRWLNFRICGSS